MAGSLVPFASHYLGTLFVMQFDQIDTLGWLTSAKVEKQIKQAANIRCKLLLLNLFLTASVDLSIIASWQKQQRKIPNSFSFIVATSEIFPEWTTIVLSDISFSIWHLRERWKSWYWRFELTIAIEPSWKGVPCNVRCSVFVLFVCVRLCICIRHTWIHIWLKREKNKINLRKYLSWPLPLNRRDRAFLLPQTQASKAANFEHR